MKNSNLLLVSASLLLMSNVFAQNKGIYGADNRKDIYDTTNPSFLELAKSTAAMIPNKNLKKPLFKKEYKIKSGVLTDMGICSSERFSTQLTAANCSGFLVAPNKLVTAGHCMTSESDCSKNKWVFDYKMDSADQSEIRVPVSSVYECKRIIAQALDKTTKNDYAIIELDRNVTDRTPLKFRTSGKPSVGDELVVIGHPTGLPTKIADGAKVRSVGNVFFTANLDTYGGNSGSAVFNVKTEEVEGILVRGDKDYQYNSGRTCRVSVRCEDEKCRGEDVTHITNVPGLAD